MCGSHEAFTNVKEGALSQFLFFGGCFGLWPRYQFPSPTSLRLSFLPQKREISNCCPVCFTRGYAESMTVKMLLGIHTGLLALPLLAFFLTRCLLLLGWLLLLVWGVCLLSIFPAASLTSWLACVHESLFIKLLYIVLNKHIKETFRMSLAEQMNKNRWAI